MNAPRSAPAISAVVPTYNDVGRIGDALSAIAAQTLTPLEIVVADDGSDDGTEQFVAEFAESESRGIPVLYARLERTGAWAARNKAIELARGDWIANCDSDDIWLPTKLERQASFIREWRGSRPIALLGTYGYNINDAKRIVSPAIMGPITEQEYEAVFSAGEIFYVIHSSALFSRAAFDAVGGYDDEYGAADDFPFFCRMAEHGVVLNMPEQLVLYRKRPGSVITHRFWDLRLNLERLSENERRRAAGEAPLRREQFAARLAAQPRWQRLRRSAYMWAMYHYRRGATDMVNGHRLRGAARLAVSLLLSPGRAKAGLLGVARHRLARRAGRAAG